MDNIDWALLRKQKAALVEYAMNGTPIPIAIADGLINFLDAFQDATVEGGSVAPHEVFGYLIAK
jgi:hypothetical protein